VVQNLVVSFVLNFALFVTVIWMMEEKAMNRARVCRRASQDWLELERQAESSIYRAVTG